MYVSLYNHVYMFNVALGTYYAQRESGNVDAERMGRAMSRARVARVRASPLGGVESVLARLRKRDGIRASDGIGIRYSDRDRRGLGGSRVKPCVAALPPRVGRHYITTNTKSSVSVFDPPDIHRLAQTDLCL